MDFRLDRSAEQGSGPQSRLCKPILEGTASPSWLSWYLGVPYAGTYPPRYSMIYKRIARQTTCCTNGILDKRVA